MRIIVGNLPDDVSEEGIRTALSPFAPVEKIKLVKDSGTPSALIEMEMTRPQAEALPSASTGASIKAGSCARGCRPWTGECRSASERLSAKCRRSSPIGSRSAGGFVRRPRSTLSTPLKMDQPWPFHSSNA